MAYFIFLYWIVCDYYKQKFPNIQKVSDHFHLSGTETKITTPVDTWTDLITTQLGLEIGLGLSYMLVMLCTFLLCLHWVNFMTDAINYSDLAVRGPTAPTTPTRLILDAPNPEQYPVTLDGFDFGLDGFGFGVISIMVLCIKNLGLSCGTYSYYERNHPEIYWFLPKVPGVVVRFLRRFRDEISEFVSEFGTTEKNRF